MVSPQADLRKRYLRPIIAGAIVFGFACWAMIPELGVNLFSDALAAAFAIYAIDEVTARAERDRRKSIYITMSARLFKIRSLIFNLVESQAATVLQPGDEGALRRAVEGDQSGLADILLRIELHAEAGWMARPRHMPLGVRVRWGDFIREEMNSLATEVGSFVSQFGMYAEPDLIASLGPFAAAPSGTMVLDDGSLPYPVLFKASWERFLDANSYLGMQITKMKAEGGVATAPHELDQLSLDPGRHLLHNFASYLSSQDMMRQSSMHRVRPEWRPYSPGRYSNARQRSPR